MRDENRKRLPHDLPLWIDPSKEIYYVTVCCQPRWQNHLAYPEIAKRIFETVQFRNDRHIWFVYVLILMPDHLHALVSFPPSGKSIKDVISQWKEWLAKKVGIHWQRDFFEHRLRTDESRREKADYILNNPLRAGLVSRPEVWPFVWFPGVRNG
jgi:putative transposase